MFDNCVDIIIKSIQYLLSVVIMKVIVVTEYEKGSLFCQLRIN